ncbi:hypothetical protein PTTG_05979 [Puccinia triticina 1-1 BBBD Race 1]|uniref:Uncharacterized protein n=1 Tax=Puccinia triticina (isolate 1-1 / race 1 (BBBD)) TaxID=630390 RepID=A0A180GAR1_PUCT1|nr:hypothetical protein PTTG_05979 [Puccinia triticina 1-1 BBBD Race 1]
MAPCKSCINCGILCIRPIPGRTSPPTTVLLLLLAPLPPRVTPTRTENAATTHRLRAITVAAEGKTPSPSPCRLAPLPPSAPPAILCLHLRLAPALRLPRSTRRKRSTELTSLSLTIVSLVAPQLVPPHRRPRRPLDPKNPPPSSLLAAEPMPSANPTGCYECSTRAYDTRNCGSPACRPQALTLTAPRSLLCRQADHRSRSRSPPRLRFGTDGSGSQTWSPICTVERRNSVSRSPPRCRFSPDPPVVDLTMADANSNAASKHITPAPEVPAPAENPAAITGPFCYTADVCGSRCGSLFPSTISQSVSSLMWLCEDFTLSEDFAEAGKALGALIPKPKK